MSERIQDQRPVYMGTFSKYAKSFEGRIALLENDMEDLAKKTRISSRRIVTCGTNELLVLILILVIPNKPLSIGELFGSVKDNLEYGC